MDTLRLSDESVSRLSQNISEGLRATRTKKRRYIDIQDNIRKISIKQHSIIFGRRGSGKTMLLSELEGSINNKEQGIIWIDIDEHKNLEFPDVLIQILREIYKNIKVHLINNKTIWGKFKFWNKSINISNLEKFDKEMTELLHEFIDTELTEERAIESKDSTEDSINAEISSVTSTGSVSRDTISEKAESVTTQVKGRKIKIETLHKKSYDIKSLLKDCLSEINKEFFIVFDDFYHLDIFIQAPVLDYMQNLFKNLNVYLKVGTIMHRSVIYVRSDLISGMQLNHDVFPIYLDRSFQNYQSVEDFIKKIWSHICDEVDENINFDLLFSGNSRDQLILASGGVPRDFLNIINKSIEVGRDRRKEKLDVKTINESANLYRRETKYEDLKSDMVGDADQLEKVLTDVTEFCVSKKKNVFLINKDELVANPDFDKKLKQLLDFRFIHQVHDNTSIGGKSGRYEAYLLDVGMYAHPQRRGVNKIEEVHFWERDDKHRAEAIRNSPLYQIRDTYNEISAISLDEDFISSSEDELKEENIDFNDPQTKLF